MSRVRSQAQQDSIPLSDREIQQLTFSEEVATAHEIVAAAQFDASEDSAALERKVTRLLRHAYDADKQSGTDAVWQEHLSALRDVDVYILVMIDRARIPRPQPEISALQISWKDVVPQSQSYAFALLVIVLAGLVGLYILRR